MMNVNITNNLHVPDFDFSEDLLNIAERIFIPIMQQNIENQVTIDGEAFPDLDKKTIARKQKLGQGDKTLIATRELIESLYASPVSENAVVISIKYNRYDIASYLQVSGIRSKTGTKFFKFFGVNQEMEDNAIAYMKSRIHDAIAAG